MFSKRIMDIIVSMGLIVLTLPAMVLVAILIKIDSCGPTIFFQKRVGMNRRRRGVRASHGSVPAYDRRKGDLGGRPFTMVKFRSMIQEAEEMLPCLVNLAKLNEPVYKLDNDPRVTRFGKFIRKTSLDELPQLFNILKGDMSLVGPRPEAMDIVALYGASHKERLQVVPGLTGLQQIMCRGTKSMQERLKWDLEYIQHRSLWLDLKILFRTFFVVIRGDGAR